MTQTKSPASWSLYSSRRDRRYTTGCIIRSHVMQRTCCLSWDYSNKNTGDQQKTSIDFSQFRSLEVQDAGSFPVRACFSSHRRCPLSHSRSRAPPWGLFIRARMPFTRLHLHDLITSQKAHLLIPSHWGLGFQHRTLGATRTLSSQQMVTASEAGPRPNTRSAAPQWTVKSYPTNAAVFPLPNNLLKLLCVLNSPCWPYK